MPPKSNWKPKEQAYVPPKSEWTPPEQTVPTHVTNDDYTPPKKAWTPVTNEPVAEPKHVSPQEQLIEMGFANRYLFLKYCGQERPSKQCLDDIADSGL